MPSGTGSQSLIALDTQARRYHTDSTPDLLIRDVPADVHEALKAGAQRNGQSLQQYVRIQLMQVAHRSQVEGLFAALLTAHGAVDAGAAVEEVQAERVSRDHRC